jgi:murein DD-endopeptidase MepM/ murein hydrolase activator NlpD
MGINNFLDGLCKPRLHYKQFTFNVTASIITLAIIVEFLDEFLIQSLQSETAISVMAFKFITQPLLSGLYEPEGIYLHTPLEGRALVVQYWGEHPDFYAQFRYNGVPLKGHIGLDFATPVGTNVLAVDHGRVVEISYEAKGFGRYVKVEHAWGESFFAHLEDVVIESGQVLVRGHLLGYSGDNQGAIQPHLHVGLRVKPYNRHDGWGGFTDPLPFFSASDLFLPDEETTIDGTPVFSPPPMAIETSTMRRP